MPWIVLQNADWRGYFSPVACLWHRETVFKLNDLNEIKFKAQKI